MLQHVLSSIRSLTLALIIASTPACTLQEHPTPLPSPTQPLSSSSRFLNDPSGNNPESPKSWRLFAAQCGNGNPVAFLTQAEQKHRLFRDVKRLLNKARGLGAAEATNLSLPDSALVGFQLNFQPKAETLQLNGVFDDDPHQPQAFLGHSLLQTYTAPQAEVLFTEFTFFKTPTEFFVTTSLRLPSLESCPGSVPLRLAFQRFDETDDVFTLQGLSGAWKVTRYRDAKNTFGLQDSTNVLPAVLVALQEGADDERKRLLGLPHDSPGPSPKDLVKAFLHPPLGPITQTFLNLTGHHAQWHFKRDHTAAYLKNHGIDADWRRLEASLTQRQLQTTPATLEMTFTPEPQKKLIDISVGPVKLKKGEAVTLTLEQQDNPFPGS